MYVELILRSSNLLRLDYSMLMLIDYNYAPCLDLSDIFLVSLIGPLPLNAANRSIMIV